MKKTDDIKPEKSEYKYNGGYSLEPLTKYDGNKCDIDRVDASNMTREEFIKDYLSIGKPVILKNLMNEMPANENFKKDKIENHFQSTKLKTGYRPYSKTVIISF